MSNLPAPRFQLRWRKPTKKELKRGSVGFCNAYPWTCVYELVLPLAEHDCRRTDKKPETVLEISRTFTSSVNPEAPGDSAPFRDGAHANWDSKALGGVPVYVIGGDGTAFLQARQNGDPRS